MVILSQSEVRLKPGEMMSVSCNISGNPVPSLQWIKKGPDGNTVGIAPPYAHILYNE